MVLMKPVDGQSLNSMIIRLFIFLIIISIAGCDIRKDHNATCVNNTATLSTLYHHIKFTKIPELENMVANVNNSDSVYFFTVLKVIDQTLHLSGEVIDRSGGIDKNVQIVNPCDHLSDSIKDEIYAYTRQLKEIMPILRSQDRKTLYNDSLNHILYSYFYENNLYDGDYLENAMIKDIVYDLLILDVFLIDNLFEELSEHESSQ